MFDINIAISFLGGLASFFAPCVLPLLPTYISYVVGETAGEIKSGHKKVRARILTSSFFYVVGFSIVFTLLGVFAGALGQFIFVNRLLINRVAGVLIIIFGLEFLGVFNFGFLNRRKQIKFPRGMNRDLRAFVLGVIYATVWSPCVGAILGSILALAATSQRALSGGIMLFAYSLGISTPFVLVSLGLVSSKKILAAIEKKIGVVATIAGVLLIALGAALLTDTYKYIYGWVQRSVNIY